MSANLGAQEVIGMAASGAKYGMMTSHFYWVGAIPAMVFLAIFMMPFYYGSKARSVPEYLKLRFDEKTRGLNAFSFAIMTIMSSGISMYAMGLLLNLLLGWDFNVSMWLCAGIVLLYIILGGLTSAIYNEVLQFLFIVFGFAPLTFIALKDVGGWAGLKIMLAKASVAQGFAPNAFSQSWRYLDSAQANPMGVEWFGLVMGLGFVLSFGYWCTDFLIVQRAMAANSLLAARRTPLIAAIPKMLFPFLVILPGMIALGLSQQGSMFHLPLKADGSTNFDLVIPQLLVTYLPNGLLGVGLTALVASFMSGMAGNLTAFNTVWTNDIYRPYIKSDASDHHYLWMGRLATLVGVVLSLFAAYFAMAFNNIMDVLQLVFAFINAPLFATFLLAMFWHRANGHGAFAGLITGTIAAAIHHGLTLPLNAHAGLKGGWIEVTHLYPSEMAQNFWTAIYAFSGCFIATIIISLLTKAPDRTQLRGLVYSETDPTSDPDCWWERPWVLGVAALLAVATLNVLFW
jgi:SSS family solute:Na+ symporter